MRLDGVVGKSMSNQVKTPEQIEAEQIRYAEQQSASAVFRRHNPLFALSAKNANKMKDLLGMNDWTLENLQAVYDAHPDAFDKNAPYEPPKAKPIEAVPEVLPPWGKLNSFVDVDRIPRALYRQFLKDPNFKRDVENAVKGSSR
jgi:hypothetical protein